MINWEELEALCAIPGISGDEDQVAEFIIKAVTPHCDRVRRDALGNVIVMKKGARSTARPLMFCAHMDEVGLIITSQKDDVTYTFDTVGGIDAAVLPGKGVCHKNGRGIVVTPPVHMTGKEERENS